MKLIIWLLSLHQLIWFIAGAVSFSVITAVSIKLKQEGTTSKSGMTLVVFSAAMGVLSVLWSYDSYLENEVRAANMGIILFGGISVVLALLAHKQVSKARKLKSTK